MLHICVRNRRELSFIRKPGSFFLSPVSLETDDKKWQFLWQFLCQSWIFWQFHETVIWLKCWNCQFGRKKLKLPAAAKPRAGSFNFFPAESDSFNILCQYHGFMKLAQKFQLWYKTVTKLPFLFVSFQVKLCDNKIKKWTRFGYETVLLADFCQNDVFFGYPLPVKLLYLFFVILSVVVVEKGMGAQSGGEIGGGGRDRWGACLGVCVVVGWGSWGGSAHLPFL